MEIELKKLKYYDDTNEKVINLIDQDFEIVSTGAFCRLVNVETIKLPINCKIEPNAFISMKNLKTVFLGETIEIAYQKNYFYDCPNASSNSLENFTEVLVKDLTNQCYFIPSYQRGYKWGKEEIEKLLNDLYEVKNDPDAYYPLQPLVVKEMKPDDLDKITFDFDYNTFVLDKYKDRPFVEVIDGQQRTTTISLILTEFNKLLDVEDSYFYDISYQTKRYSDKYFTDNAKEIIIEWLSKKKIINSKKAFKNNNKRTELDDFRSYILNNVCFFYYIVSAESKESPNELFNNINKAVKLTNAELFKSFLLNTDGYSDVEKSEAKKIAYEWDQVERRMNNPEFWAFLSCDSYNDKTKIDLLLDVFAYYAIHSTTHQYNILVETRETDSLYSYDVLREEFNKIKDENNNSKITAVIKIWNEIMDVFNFFMKLFSDYELYHYIGFLRHAETSIEKFDLKVLYVEYKKENSTSIEFLKFVCSKVKQVFYNSQKELNLDTINYVKDVQQLRDVFLYFNIWTTMTNKRMKLRFPFFAHKNSYIIENGVKKDVTWQIEHINPRSLGQIPAGFDVQEYSKAYLGEANAYTIPADFIAYVDDKKNDPTIHFNKIENLCLLDSVTNNIYKDSPFNIKRNYIVHYDALSTYIPISTKQIFLKALDENKDLTIADNSLGENLWTLENQNKYLERIQKCFSFSEKEFE